MSAQQRDRIRINDSNLKVTTLAVIAAICEKHGLIDYITPKPQNPYIFHVNRFVISSSFAAFPSFTVMRHWCTLMRTGAPDMCKGGHDQKVKSP
jgi:hypothetical protein